MVVLADGYIHIAIKFDNRRLILLSHISQAGCHLDNLLLDVLYQLFTSLLLLTNCRYDLQIFLYTV